MLMWRKWHVLSTDCWIDICLKFFEWAGNPTFTSSPLNHDPNFLEVRWQVCDSLFCNSARPLISGQKDLFPSWIWWQNICVWLMFPVSRLNSITCRIPAWKPNLGCFQVDSACNWVEMNPGCIIIYVLITAKTQFGTIQHLGGKKCNTYWFCVKRLAHFVFHGRVTCSRRQWSILRGNTRPNVPVNVTAVCDVSNGSVGERFFQWSFAWSLVFFLSWMSKFSLYCCCLTPTSAVTQPQKNTAKMGKCGHDKQMTCMYEFSCELNHDFISSHRTLLLTITSEDLKAIVLF